MSSQPATGTKTHDGDDELVRPSPIMIAAMQTLDVGDVDSATDVSGT